MSRKRKASAEIVRSWPKPGVLDTWVILRDPLWYVWFQLLDGFAFGWAVLKILRWWLA